MRKSSEGGIVTINRAAKLDRNAAIQRHHAPISNPRRGVMEDVSFQYRICYLP
jgi:hypothetical protein